MLSPRRVKYRKQHRGNMRGLAKGGTDVHFGDYGLQAVTHGWITNRPIEAARIAMTRYMKRGGKGWINIFPHKASPKKPAQNRLGSGKGPPEGRGAVGEAGRVLFQPSGV